MKNVAAALLLFVCFVSNASIKLTPSYSAEQKKEYTQFKFDSTEELKFVSDNFQLEDRYDFSSVSKGASYAVGINNEQIVLMDVGENNKLSFRERYSFGEFGLIDISPSSVFLSNDESRILVGANYYDRGISRNVIKLIVFNLTNGAIELLTQDTVETTNYSSIEGMATTSDLSHFVIFNGTDNTVNLFQLSSDGEVTQLDSYSTSNYSSILAIDIRDNDQLVTVVYRGYSGSTLNCLETYALSADQTLVLADSLTCNSANYLPYVNNARVVKNGSGVFLSNSTDLALYNINDAGNISSNFNVSKDSVTGRANTRSNFYYIDAGLLEINNSYPRNISLYSINGDSTYSLLSTRTLQELTGRNYLYQIVQWSDNSIFTRLDSQYIIGSINIGQNQSVIAEITDYSEQTKISQLLRQNSIPVSNERVISFNAGNINLISQTVSKHFELLQQIPMQNSYVNQVTNLGNGKILFLDYYRYFIVQYNAEQDSIQLVGSGSFTDANGSSISLSTDKRLNVIIDDRWLVAKSGSDRLALIELVDNEFVFREYAIDFAGGFSGITNSNSLFSIGNNIYLVNQYDSEISKITLQNGSLEANSESYAVQMSNYSSDIQYLENFVVLTIKDLAYTFVEESNKLKLKGLSVVKSNSSGVLKLGSRHLLFSLYDEYYIYRIDTETGLLESSEFLPFSELSMPVSPNNIRFSNYDGRYLYYHSNSYNGAYGRLDVNRAPQWFANSSRSIEINEGKTEQLNLNEYILDLDDEEILNFDSDSLPATLTLENSTGLLNYNGEPESTSELSISSTDGELSSHFSFDVISNQAPRLIDPATSIEVNENESLAIDLASMYEDKEGDKFVLQISSQNLEMLANGTLVGYFTGNGEQPIDFIATDERGATKTEAIIFSVNGAPSISGSLNVQMKEGETSSIDLNTIFSDPESDGVNFSISGLPSGLTNLNGVISGKPGTAGQYAVIVTATDQKGAQTEVTLKISVAKKSDSGGGAMGIWLIFLAVFGFRKMKSH